MNRCRRIASLVVGTLLCCALISCRKHDPAAAANAAREIARYTVRGLVEDVPRADDPRSAFRVRHEAIPDFRRTDGTLGMNTMTMEFRPGPGMSLAGIERGDKIVLTFETEYENNFTKVKDYYATKVEELPADTELDFTPLGQGSGKAGGEQ